MITIVQTPRLNGTALCAHLLKERPKIKEMFIVSADVSDAFTCYASLPLVAKPIDGQVLRAKVKEVFDTPV